jgi:hypothetical protein
MLCQERRARFADVGADRAGWQTLPTWGNLGGHKGAVSHVHGKLNRKSSVSLIYYLMNVSLHEWSQYVALTCLFERTL